MKRVVGPLAAALAVALVGCGGGDDAEGGSNASSPGPGTTAAAAPVGIEAMQATIDDLSQQYPTLRGIVVHIDVPARGIDESLASGDNVDGPLSADATFRVASNTKTFTAAAVLRLVEQGKVDIDGPVTQCVDPQLVTILEGDGYVVDELTVRRLLQHTDGIFDFGQEPGYFDAVFTDPTHRWTRAEQVQWAVDHGDPLGAPGDAFAYGNTGYVLLASLIECTSGMPLADAYRQLLDFDGLGLDATYLESLEPVPPGAGPRAHQLFGDVDTFAFDPSMNLNGDGGLVTSAADLAHFGNALLGGEVFDQPATLATMLEPVDGEPSAGMGIFHETLDGMSCWSHQGLWGTALFVCPDEDLTISASMQQGELDDVDLNPILFTAFEIMGR